MRVQSQTGMDEESKTATARNVFRYLEARTWFRGTKLPRTSTGARLTPESLAEDLGQGRRLLADGVLVHPTATPPVVGDDTDPDFLAAMKGQDGAIELSADQLRKIRTDLR